MKVIFIVNSIQNQRCIKRISEFVSEGADVQVYAYSRQSETYTNNTFPIEIIGRLDNSLSYSKRFPILYRSIKYVVNKYRKSRCLFYLFGLDIAMVFRLQCKREKYIYEESDLVHTYVNNSLLKCFLESVDKRIIKKSVKTVFTSEGFAIYHFGDKRPSNVIVIPNRLNSSILNLDYSSPKTMNQDRIRIGFVGKPRFKSVVNFAKVLCEYSDRFEFHIFGGPILEEVDGFRALEKYSNYYYHGPFKNPDDLPKVYSSIDLVLSTYDIEYENVRFAEPNKIYEALYFETPIIVSNNTFLAQKVERLGIGFSVDPLNDEEVKALLRTLNTGTIQKKQVSCASINKDSLIDSNHQFIQSLLLS